MAAAAHVHDILIVEDDPSIRYLEAVALDRRGMRVMVAEDGRQALDLLKQRNFCLVILDLIMPKVEGYMVIKYIEENKPSIPIIVVTGLKPDELSAVDRRVVKQILFKPIELEKLIEDVRGLCEVEGAESASGATASRSSRKSAAAGTPRKKPRLK